MSKPLSDPILQQYHDVFSDLGELPGEYTIQIKADAVLVINPPRRLPVTSPIEKYSQGRTGYDDRKRNHLPSDGTHPVGIQYGGCM